MPAREYCCCAIPIIYSGIYATLLEQLVLGIVAGTLSIGTPPIVGASTPSFAKWIFAVICWVAAGLQLLGFIAVRQEKAILFRRYVTLHSLVTVAAFGVAAAWIAISATRHTQAQDKCIADFFAGTVSANNSEGQTLCNIFPWADIGIMGALWVLLGIMQVRRLLLTSRVHPLTLSLQLYLYSVLSAFRKGQSRDHTKYESLMSEKSMNNIPLEDRGGAWGSRSSTERLVQNSGHARQDSTRNLCCKQLLRIPPNVHTADPTPTPNVHDGYYDQPNAYGAGVGYPARSQAHPGEF
ncbi:uncharacterized protein BXZ73DRAFT_87031 [Epithele typhae]|uniref:uncharacterized protein n=1 Tax=Epithele typhae TaxID=378194 RepID=UPI0020089EB1|nr:uncharacterized protein BXZ73DRAFT_87031 [Epithele typhae]KAH9944063.1 hypothetical protein BXZ73DRAFT_87031 [Epithele typhae]